MSRLPDPGGDKNTWGDILNDYLLQSLTQSGRLRDEVVEERHLSQDVRVKINGFLSANPTVFSVSKSNDSVSLVNGATVAAVVTAADASAAGVMSSADKAKLDTVAANAQPNSVLTVASRTGNVLLSKSDVGLANVDDTKDADKPISTAMQAALDAKANFQHTHVAADVTDGIFSPARLGSGGANANSYLRGDGAWAQLPDASHVAANVRTAAYTLALSDDSKAVEINVSSAVNVTVPSSATVNFPVGTVIEIVQIGSGQVVLVPAGGVALRTPSTLTTRTAWSTIGLRKRAADEWIVSGDLV